MSRRGVLLAVIPVNVGLAVIADNAWSRVAGICIALGCVFALLNARTTNRKDRP